MTQEKRDELEAHAKLFDVPIEVREIVDDWLLLTYDLPKSAEGDVARYWFLKEARKLGAVGHTESVYLMPWTIDASILAVELSRVGKTYIWHTKVDDEKMARELTMHYDMAVANWLDDLNGRLERIGGHIANRKLKLAGHMVTRTLAMIAEMRQVINRRGSERLRDELARIEKELFRVMASVVV